MKDTFSRIVVTGGAGFIGSHLAETFLKRNEQVLIIDNLSTGKESNVESVRSSVGLEASKRLEFSKSDVTDEAALWELLRPKDVILHHAALGSVPRSIADPMTSTRSNIDGFVTILHAAMRKGIKRFVFASSSSVYGDDTTLPKKEERIGNPISPYAVTKRADELFGSVYASLYGMSVVGLRYFNIFGPRQDPNGAYAAVIPRWISYILSGQSCVINGDGSISRDFCFVENVVNANLSAISLPEKTSGIFNIACGEGTNLVSLYKMIQTEISKHTGKTIPDAKKGESRAGDIQHSLADLTNARKVLGYEPRVSVVEGIRKTVQWYLNPS